MAARVPQPVAAAVPPMPFPMMNHENQQAPSRSSSGSTLVMGAPLAAPASRYDISAPAAQPNEHEQASFPNEVPQQHQQQQSGAQASLSSSSTPPGGPPQQPPMPTPGGEMVPEQAQDHP